jgi:hypothetical protein
LSDVVAQPFSSPSRFAARHLPLDGPRQGKADLNHKAHQDHKEWKSQIRAASFEFIAAPMVDRPFCWSFFVSLVPFVVSLRFN